MIWQFTGVGPHNKGAELMFLAMRDAVMAQDEKSQICMQHGSQCSYSWRARQGLWQIWDAHSGGKLRLLRNKLFHKGYRDRYGMIDQNTVDIVLDGSGFAYGDQWKAEWMENTASYYERLRSYGVKIVLLPQALGPFQSQRQRHAAKRIFSTAEIIFARDDTSHRHASALVDDGSALRMAPDFTNALSGSLPADWKINPRHVAIIPNRQMTLKGSDADAKAYRVNMANAIDLCKSNGYYPFVLIHEVTDELLGEEIIALSKESCPLVKYDDPLYLKGILGNVAFAVGSRFHALINCLSQGVPAVGTSWSHKYQHLYADYGVGDLLVEDMSSVGDAVNRLMVERERVAVGSLLLERSRRLKSDSDVMWDSVRKCTMESHVAVDKK